MYIECPHCAAIFALPEGLDYADNEKKMRCGECSTVLYISEHLTTSIKETNNQSSHFNFDHMFTGELYKDIEAPAKATAHSSSSIYDSLDDTIELPDEQIASIDTNEQEADNSTAGSLIGDVKDDVFDSEITISEETSAELIETKDNNNDLPESFDSSLTPDDAFEDYIKRNQLQVPDQGEGITSKDNNSILEDGEDLLPEINLEIDQHAAIDNATNPTNSQTQDDFHNNPGDIDFPTLEPPEEHSAEIVTESTPDSGSQDNTWAELPTLDNLQLIKEEDLQHLSHSGMSSNDSVQRDIVNSEPVDETPVFVTNEDEELSQASLSMEIQEDLLGENFIDIPVSDSDMGEDVPDNNTDFTPANTLLSINKEDFFDSDNQLTTSAPAVSIKKTILYTTISLLLILLLGAQYVYNNRLEMASSPTTKPLVAVICKITGCEVKIKRNPDLIETLDKSIYNLPDSENILVIKATIKNKAAYPQPYPVVEILFSDINENSLALRRFGPAEYLQDIPKHELLMPTEEAVHLQLQVADPGRNATSFRFNYL